ncbi:helix-turn-helix domain-containing protein [Bacillus lacus]|uniref:Helix-turn-helix domain-containing protein n=1 Tax=Metabacillus lacus TaxID=1983721 RepID=A0A7X2LX43_9BACI|nr:helix-turn-helix domain-containing protein [Metabacillus lacus]
MNLHTLLLNGQQYTRIQYVIVILRVVPKDKGGVGLSYLGRRLKELRQGSGLSLRELGERINMNYSHLSRLENGQKIPSLETIELLAKFFEVKASYLLGEVDTYEFNEDEEDFVKDLDLSLKEVQEKYNITFEGKPVTDEELKDILTYLKVKRDIKK